jgi:replicative DNA helicase
LDVIYIPRGCSIINIEEEAYKIQERRGQKVDLIVVDYLNLMKPISSKGNSRDWKGQADIGWDIKELCAEFNDGEGVALWTANQITDEGKKAKKLDTSHLKYSRAISEVAPIIVALTQTEDDFLQEIMKLWIIKARDFRANKADSIILRPDFDKMILHKR